MTKYISLHDWECGTYSYIDENDNVVEVCETIEETDVVVEYEVE